MIILKHLIVERFRLLREINLHFPQRGSILIQGPNEAGKSALFESIYFALYGMTMAANREKRGLDDLILYGTAQASVTLTLAIGVTEMTITRILERGKGQTVTLHVQRLGMPPEEPITQLDTANERIIAELGRLDGETLRNSCFIEQKGLARLEELAGSEREETVRKLLGLENLLPLTEQFKLTPHDEQSLKNARERLQLALIQAAIPPLSTRLGRLEEMLDAKDVLDDLAEISQQEADIAEQDISLEALRARRTNLKSQQHRIQQLHQADATLGDIIAAYDTIAEAQRELPELQQEIMELDRREREELPGLEKRVQELADLTRSFGTLERMSNDLLTSVNTIKELEKEVRSYQETQEDGTELDVHIDDAQQNVEQARQALLELEEQRRASRPQFEARLQRLQGLNERVEALHAMEEAYTQRFMQQGVAEANAAQIAKVKQKLQDAEKELAQVESSAQQAGNEADELEKYGRQLSIRRQLEEWQRQKEFSQSLAEAEYHVRVAHQHQEKLTTALLEARQVVSRWLIFIIATSVLGLVLGVGALLLATQQTIVASILGLLAIGSLFGISYWVQNYNRARKEEQIANQRMQEAITQVGMMVAARETALRMSANLDALAQTEQELRSLGGPIPQSRDEAQQLIQQLVDNGESSTAIQQRETERHKTAQALLNQTNTVMEAVVNLRREYASLEEQRTAEGWDDLVNKLRLEHTAIEDKQYEIATLAGQEGLPIPNFDPNAAGNIFTTSADFVMVVTEAIEATEREITALDGKHAQTFELEAQVKGYQESLDALLARKQVITERNERFLERNPVEQIERAREQQVVLRTALQSLQDSLRQRVKPLGVAFGQAAIGNAETIARKQLEALHIALGRRIDLQSRRHTYATDLKEHQDSLSDHYNRLSRFSGTLGSWIVPLNPFTEALIALQVRCQREIKDANESSITDELAKLQLQERASQAKVSLCQQEIEETRERIAAILVRHKRPVAKEYTFTSIVTIWPLLSESTSQDRFALEDERQTVEQELQQLEQQELALSTQLQVGDVRLDVEEVRLLLEQQERSYQTRKHANLLIQTVEERLLRKILPRTEYYMQHILTLLTNGRYHDVQLSTDWTTVASKQKEEEVESISGGPFSLQVWEAAAGEYLSRSAFSGGTADQLSLALRLAFAIAVLPRELSTAPGFLLLDEPLSSFDRDRTQALVNVVSGEMFSEHFEQVLLVSHSSAFDPAMFPYHLYLDGGAIIESNLPVVPVASVAPIAPLLPTLSPTTVPPDTDGSTAGDTTKSAIVQKMPVPASVDR